MTTNQPLPVYEPGETVDITIRAKVVETTRQEDTRRLDFTYSASGALIEGTVLLPPNAELATNTPVTIERVAPAAGMPKPGELWQDARDVLWFAVDGVRMCELTCDGRSRSEVAYVQRNYGPLRPVHQLAEDGGQ